MVPRPDLLTSPFDTGTYSSAVTGDTELSRLLLEFGKTDQEEGEEEEVGSGSEDTAVDETKIELEDLSEAVRLKASTALMHRADLVPIEVQKRETLKQLKASTRPKEKREQGSVKFSVYKEYIRANGYIGIACYMGTIVLQQVLSIATNVWLKNWSQHNSETGDNGSLR